MVGFTYEISSVTQEAYVSDRTLKVNEIFKLSLNKTSYFYLKSVHKISGGVDPAIS